VTLVSEPRNSKLLD